MISGNAFGQSPNDKNFRFGLKVAPAFMWYSPSEKKKFESDGSKIRFNFGAVMDFKISENIWFSTGLELTGGAGVMKYSENPTDSIGYFFRDNEIVTLTDDKIANRETGDAFMQLNTREYKTNYVNIPLTLKMRTNEIGMMTYYGQFGFDVSIKTKGRATDDATMLVGYSGATASTSTSGLTDLTIDDEMQPLLAGLNIGGGGEFNMSGSTSIFFGLNFHYGFLNAVKNTSSHLYDMDKIDATTGVMQKYEPQQFKPFGLSINVGILF